MCEHLGLCSRVSTQTLQRDRYAHYVARADCNICRKIPVEIRHLQKRKHEVEEAFAKGQRFGACRMRNQSAECDGDCESYLLRVNSL